MLDAMLADAGLTAPPSQLFGRSRFEPLPRDVQGANNSPYKRGGDRLSALKELQRSDPSFARYLKGREIDLTNVSGRGRTKNVLK